MRVESGTIIETGRKSDLRLSGRSVRPRNYGFIVIKMAHSLLNLMGKSSKKTSFLSSRMALCITMMI